MNINEDLNDEELLTENPQRLSAEIRKRGRVCVHDEGKEFNFDAVEDEVYSNGRACEDERDETI